LSTCAVCIRVTKSADHWLHFEMEILCVALGQRDSMQVPQDLGFESAAHVQ